MTQPTSKLKRMHCFGLQFRRLPNVLFPDLAEATYRTQFWLPVLVWLAVGLWVLSFAFMSSVPLNGDEAFYSRAAAAIAEYLRLSGISAEEMLNTVVGYGWFMPGMPIALQPVFIFDNDPSATILRLYASVLTFALWVVAVRVVHRTFSYWCSVPLAIFPTLVLTWQFFSATIWADLPAGLIVAIIFAKTWSIATSIFEDRPMALMDVFHLELALAVAIYLRGSVLVIAVAIHIFLAALFLISGLWQRLFARVVIIVTSGVLLAASIAPWSVVATRILGDRVLTTSTTVLSFAITFGDVDKLCFGPCQGRNIWYSSAAFSRQYAAKHSISELEVQRRMAHGAIQNLSAKNYFEQAQRNLSEFTLNPSGFANRFLQISRLDLSETTRRWLFDMSRLVTNVLYFPFLAVLALSNFVVIARSKEHQLMSLCIKMFTLCIFIQPFLHPSHARYWVGFAPLMGISAGFVAMTIARSLPGGGQKSATYSPPDRAGNALLAIQILYVTVIGATLAAILLF